MMWTLKYIVLFQISCNILLSWSYYINKKSGGDCYSNDDCGSTEICKSGFCLVVTTVSEIMSKQKCPKSRCSQDSDCGCKLQHRVCVDKECVVGKSLNKPPQQICETFLDCDVDSQICDHGKCRNIVSFKDLTLLLHSLDLHICTSDQDCLTNSRCIQGKCLKSVFNNVFLKKELQNDVTHCKTDAECLSTEICLRDACLSKARVLEDRKCIVTLLARNCYHDSDCNSCNSHQWFCNEEKCHPMS